MANPLPLQSGVTHGASRPAPKRRTTATLLITLGREMRVGIQYRDASAARVTQNALGTLRRRRNKVLLYIKPLRHICVKLGEAPFPTMSEIARRAVVGSTS